MEKEELRNTNRVSFKEMTKMNVSYMRNILNMIDLNLDEFNDNSDTDKNYTSLLWTKSYDILKELIDFSSAIEPASNSEK